MTDEVITQYTCSECGANLTSEGTNILDHMVSTHNVNPDNLPDPTGPSVIPVPENPPEE